jgi:hypothetical protein
MKKLLILLICAFQSLLLFSQEVDNALARRAAELFIINQNKNSAFTISSEMPILGDNGTILSYIFGLSPHGYVVISADKSFGPVVAYSFLSDIDVNENINPLISLIKADYSQRILHKDEFTKSFLQKNADTWDKISEKGYSWPKDTTFQQWPSSGSTPTDGWVLTKWNQSAPYNNMCPMDNGSGNRSLTGCPATAMAQIINYHQTLNGTRFSDADDYYHNYGSNQFWIDNDYATHGFPSFPELNKYLDTLENTYLSKAPLSTNSIAALSFACGVATKSVYSSSGSGTFGVDQAFDGIIRMGFTNAQLLDTSVHNPYPQIISNIKDSLPVFLAVVDPAWSTGHNLVIDGYNTNDFYHLNFGWGGSYDGWYNIPSGMPYSLTVIEGVIVDIKAPVVLGINEQRVLDHTINIFPNPCFDVAEVSFVPNNTGDYRIMLFDNFGRLISENNLPCEAKTVQQINLPTGTIKQGIYSLRITGDSETFTGKIIKL